MTDFRSHFFRLNHYSHLENMNGPKKNRPRYHLGGPTAPFMCSSYCKQAPPTLGWVQNMKKITRTEKYLIHRKKDSSFSNRLQ